MDFTQWIDPLAKLAEEAGNHILDIYETDFDVETKDDASPLTQADLASNAHIVAGLAELTPDIPIISEEFGLPEFSERGQWNCYWLIDPLDGTKEFVNRNGEFTVNIALIIDHVPVLGIVYVPVTKTCYIGCEGYGSERREQNAPPCRITVATESGNPVRVVGSRSHGGDSLNIFLENLGEIDMHPMGSSLKFCRIAEGQADIYPRLGPTSEWDTAAAHCIVEQAGGFLTDTNMQTLAYNTKESLLNPPFFVFGDSHVNWSDFI